MKTTLCLLAIASLGAFGSTTPPKPASLVGTWELIAATSTEQGKTTSTFDPTRKLIKIINATHFAFLNHALTKTDKAAPFSAGGGRYTLKGNVYTEHLEYFNDRQWEGNTFEFTVQVTGDKLVQRGVEKVEKLGVDHVIVETYERTK